MLKLKVFLARISRVRKIYTLLLLVFLTSCQTSLVSPTPVQLNNIDLAPILFQEGDLPAGYETAQVRAHRSDISINAPTPVNFYTLTLEHNNANGGITEILLYDDLENLNKAYEFIANELPGQKEDSYIGGKSRIAISHGMQYTNLMDVMSYVFVRCNAVVVFQFFQTSDQESAISYATRIDQRIQESAICSK